MTALVVDASVVVELLRSAPIAIERLAAALAHRRPLLAPELLDVEVAHVVRRFERSGAIAAKAATAFVDDLVALPIRRFSHGPLIRRAFELRDNVSAYDALYIALAEATDATLVTFDTGLAANATRFAETELLVPS